MTSQFHHSVVYFIDRIKCALIAFIAHNYRPSIILCTSAAVLFDCQRPTMLPDHVDSSDPNFMSIYCEMQNFAAARSTAHSSAQ